MANVDRIVQDRLSRALGRLDRIMNRIADLAVSANSPQGGGSLAYVPSDQDGSRQSPGATPVSFRLDPDLREHMLRSARVWDQHGMISPEGIILVQLLRDMEVVVEVLKDIRGRLGGAGDGPGGQTQAPGQER